jgi:D-tyrosyl-tRNA(Tyr) deacylase
LIGEVGAGVCIFVAVALGDEEADADYLCDKVATLRMFADQTGKMNRSLRELNGEALVVSEFTLYADCTKGQRPSFSHAATPDHAERLYNYFVERLRSAGIRVATGKFKAAMQVALVNDGPVTFVLDSR